MNISFLKKCIDDCKIVIPNEAHAVEKTAAEELCNYIEKTLSVKLAVITEDEAEGKCIYVGHTEYAKKNNILGKSKENWIIKSINGNLVLTGGEKRGDRGIIYAAYHFIEDVLGVRFWNAYEEDIPSLDELSLEADFFCEGTPRFPYRKFFMNRPLGEDGIKTYSYLPKNRINVISPLDDDITEGAYHPDVRKYGDVIHMGRPHHCHVMGKLFPRDEVFGKHPEWFAWNKARGERVKDGHRCFSNEEFFNELLRKLLKTIEEDVTLAEKEGVEFPYYYSISPDDLPGLDAFCQCPECEKIINEAGYGGYVLRFVNRVAREVAKVYPFAKIENLAYFTFSEPPKDGTLPEKNVVVRLANIYVDILRDINSVSNKRYLRLLEGWSALCKKSGAELHIWDYMFNMRMNYPLPLFYRLKDTVKAFEKYGVTGVAVEIEEHYSDMWDLNKYMLSHLVENPDLDISVMLVDFTERYYGAAGKFVREYCELLKAASEKYIPHVYCCLEDSPFNYIDAKCATKAYELLEKAEAAVSDVSLYRERVAWLFKPLCATILMKYNDLKAQAERGGMSFGFDCEELRKRVISALSRYGKHPINKLYTWNVPNETAYFNSLPKEKETLPVPEILKGERKEDIYQFSFKNLYGFLTVKDELSASGEVVKLTPDIGTLYGWGLETVPTSKFAAEKSGVKMSLMQNEKTVSGLSLYREDFNNDGYTLYKIGSVENINTTPDTALVIFVLGAVSLNLTALSVTFPMDKCDVYLALRAKGEVYGGNPSDENAICFDRMIIVRKQ